MRKVKLGVVGCGVIGPSHVEAAAKSDLLSMVAVADNVNEKVQQVAGKFGVEKTYSDGRQLIEDPDVEAVVLALPTRFRTALALHAFKHGKHVLLEKPVAMNAGEVREMQQAKGDLVCACCSSRYRFSESARVASDFVATGNLGELRVIRSRAIKPGSPPPEKEPPPWRVSKKLNGGGILVNWGCYDLDYILGITGWKLVPRLILAQTWTIPPQFQAHVAPGSDGDEHFAAMISCENGTVIVFERGEAVASQAEEACQIIGTKGSLHLAMRAAKNKKITHDNSSPEKGVFSETLWEGDEDSTKLRSGPVEDFAAAILEKGQPKTGLNQAMVVQKITDGIYSSSEKGKAVKIE